MKIDCAEIAEVQNAEPSHIAREDGKRRNLFASVLDRAIRDASGRVSVYVQDVAEHNGVKSRVFYKRRRVRGKSACVLKKELYEPLKEEYKRYLIKDAQDWLASDSQQIFSFVWICHHLDLDSGRVRGLIGNRIK